MKIKELTTGMRIVLKDDDVFMIFRDSNFKTLSKFFAVSKSGEVLPIQSFTFKSTAISVTENPLATIDDLNEVLKESKQIQFVYNHPYYEELFLDFSENGELLWTNH